MMRLGFVLAALIVITAPAVAQDAGVDPAQLAAKTLTDGGTWTFIAPRGAPKGSPVCTESWTFRADGGMTVVSGSQTVEKSWRVAEEDGFTKLYTTSLSSTSGTDCMGERANPADYPKEESGGFAVMFFGEGTNAYLCNPVVVENADGTTTPLYRNEDCWGEITASTTTKSAR